MERTMKELMEITIWAQDISVATKTRIMQRGNEDNADFRTFTTDGQKKHGMPHLYSISLQKAGCTPQAVYGNFSSPKAQEIVASHGKSLELFRGDNLGRLNSVWSSEVFGIIRSLATFRLVGSNRDYLIVGSDSGRIVILEFDVSSNSFVKVHQETFGKSGCRRIVPGEYLATDPSGRACMIAAVEKQKFVYILNRDSDQKLTISSPLEAHKSHSIVFSLCGLDVGYDNPLFASIETNYEVPESAQKFFTIYEMDLGINHVVRKYAEPLDDSAHLLIPVVGGQDGPGGCLICCENFLVYKKLGHPTLTCPYPRRADAPIDRGTMIVSHAKHKLKEFNLVLIQTEFGDVFRVDLIRNNSKTLVEEIRVTFFDSLPRCSSICITKTGFLFAASEFGNHGYYQFQSSPLLAPIPPAEATATSSRNADIPGEKVFIPNAPETFHAASRPLALFDELKSRCPLLDMKVMDGRGSGESCQIFAACGQGPRSSLRSLRYGVGVSEMAVTELPGKPSGIWTVRDKDEDKYIVISFVDVTLVLAIGDTVEEVTDSGLLGTLPTIGVGKMFDDSIVQIHARGLRHIPSASAGGSAVEWRSPEGRQVVACDYNSRQIVLVLTGGEMVYFELTSDTRTISEIAKKSLGNDVTGVSIAPVPESRTRGLFLAVSLGDRSVRVLSLEPDKLLKQVSAQSFPVVAESVAIAGGFLNVGLTNGTLVRCCLDRVTGMLSDARSRFLGVRPVRLEKILLEKKEAIMALSSRCWLVYEGGVSPLTYTATDAETGAESPVVIEYAAPFNSVQCPDGFVTVAQNTLRIIACEKLREIFSETALTLSYTPRKLAVVPPITGAESSGMRLAVLEADHNALSEKEREKLAAEFASMETGEAAVGAAGAGVVGSFGAGKGRWGSCVRLVDPTAGPLTTSFKIDFDQDECAVAISVVYFYQLKDNRPCLVVATANELNLRPCRSAKKSALKTYLYDANFVPQLVHVTPVTEDESEGVPLAMCQYEGRLLVSLSRGHTGGSQKPIAVVRLYELGKKKLLKKSEYRNTVCGGFVSLQVINDRIFAADASHSIHVLRLNRVDGQFHVICDDFVQRYMTSMLVLDYNTVVGADKFDNVFVYRIPPEVREEQSSTGESTLGSGGLRLGPDTAYILGKNPKFDMVSNFHVGETITSMQKVTMSAGAAEVIMYSTLSGSVGVLYPFSSKREYETFLALETQIRNEMQSSLVGRDHMHFRSYYLPVKGVVDGDLVQDFGKYTNKAEIASNLGKSVNEIVKMIEEIHNRIT